MSDEPKPFESVLATARKLAAMAHDERANPGERTNAADMLAKHCERYNITPERLAPEVRKWRCVLVKSRYRDDPVRRDKKLAHFCRVCLWFVVGERRPSRMRKTEIELDTRGLKVKMGRLYSLEAEVTDLEYSEWQECFDHFAPYVVTALQELRAAAREARHALDLAIPAFCIKNDIKPETGSPDAEPARQPSLRELSALLAAKKAPAFRKSGKLTDKPLIS